MACKSGVNHADLDLGQHNLSEVPDESRMTNGPYLIFAYHQTLKSCFEKNLWLVIYAGNTAIPFVVSARLTSAPALDISIHQEYLMWKDAMPSPGKVVKQPRIVNLQMVRFIVVKSEWMSRFRVFRFRLVLGEGWNWSTRWNVCCWITSMFLKNC